MKRQKGVALFMVLVILIITTLLGISAMQVANMETRMVTNFQSGPGVGKSFSEAENGLAVAWGEARDDFSVMTLGHTNSGSINIAATYDYEVIQVEAMTGLDFIVVRSVGEVPATGGYAVVGATFLQGELPVNMNSALSLHPAGSVTVKGNSTISGLNHNVPTDFDCNGTGCEGTLNGANDVIGIYSDTDVGDLTEIGSTTIEGAPDTQNGGGPYDQDYWMEWATNMIPLATVFNGADGAGNVSWGTRDAPVIHVIDQNMLINGNLDGAGVLILTGDGTEVTINGNFHFEGLIIAASPTAIDLTIGGTARLYGSVVAASPSVEIDVGPSGTPGIFWSLEALGNLNKAFTVRRTAWYQEMM